MGVLTRCTLGRLEVTDSKSRGADGVRTIGVAIVAFRGGEAPIRTLDALAEAVAGLEPTDAIEVVVVDNASGDGTADRLRAHPLDPRIVELAENVGFAAGCNVAAGRLADADPIVFLNPDVRVQSDFLARLARLDWPADLAARGPMVLGHDGRLEQSARGFPGARTALLGRSSWLARRWPQSPLLRRDLLAGSGAESRIVDWVSGACLIASRAALAVVGPFDEGYFMYWEDADWCFRAREAGLGTEYEPRLVVLHDQGASSSGRMAATTIAFHRSALRYWRLHVARTPVSVAVAAVALGARCILRLLVLAATRLGARARQG